ncbi:MAG: hypothetical protein IKP89_07330 [Bacteroidales bacterium]|nr:hypothetical protein [Bacteroidales bacterium]
MKPVFFHSFRENYKFFIWDYIDKVHNILKTIGIFVSFFTMAVIAYYYGFPQTPASALTCKILIHCSLIFYILKYLLCAFFSVHATEYIRKNIFEGVVILCIILWYFFTYLSPAHSGHGFSLSDISDISDITMLLIQIYFFFMMLFELSNMGQLFNRFRFGPRGWMVCSFLLLIIIGAILLMLPEMTTGGIGFFNALFTATSASTITGLTVVDTAAAFTRKGQVVILLLMQLGGINIICFATFLSTSYKETKVRSQSIMQELLNTSYSGSKTMLRTILGYTFIIELIGFFLFFIYWNHNQYYSHSLSQNIFLSAFHAIASFNNSGISIIDGGMMNPIYSSDYYVQIVTLLLFTLGSLGFVTLHDLFSNHFHRYRGKSYWKQLKVTTRITLGMTGVLVLLGTLCFFFFEKNYSTAGQGVGQRLMSSLFMASSSRSCGFSTLDTNLLSLPTLLLFICLMFIGSSPTSTGGGIKVTTFYILIRSIGATIKGRKEVTISNRAIPGHLIDKSYTVAMLAIGLMVGSILLLSISDPQFTLEQIMFETTSALGNVGMSVNISSGLSNFGKCILIMLMFIGRITILTMAISVTRKASQNYSLVKTNLSIS